MSKIYVVYWSGTGNTEEMAKNVCLGVEEAGAETELIEVSNASAEELVKENAFALGCPAMGAEVLEEDEMEPFVQSLEPLVSGKHIALFGSYGWGDETWMRDWETRMKNAGADIVEEQGITILGEPDDDVKQKCKEIGKKLAELNK